MPYMKVDEDGKVAVYKQGEDGKPMGKRLGLHDSEEKADKQIAAIYVNEKAIGEKAFELAAKDWDEMPTMSTPMKLDQGDPRVQYGPLLGTDTQACANCQWFCARNASCGLVWDDIVATGKCSLWLGKPSPAEPTPIPVVIVDQPATDSAELPPPVEKKESPIMAWLKQTFGKKADEPLIGSGFKALPNNKWVSYYSNSFEDKTGEIFTETATDQYIDLLDKGLIPYPDLLYWHVLGTKHGEAEWIGRERHINIAVGSFDGSDMANLFRKEYEKTPHRTSHTYAHPKAGRDENGHYVSYFDVELSPLPVGKEANVWTPFMDIKELETMPITPEKRAKLEAILGKELAEQTLDTASKMSADLESLGLKWKEAGGLPSVDQDARDTIKEVAMANKAAIETSQKSITDILTTIQMGMKAIQDGEAARNKAVTDLETFVKEQFALQPRASRSTETVVPPTDPNATFLAAKAADPNAGPQGGSVGEQIAGMIVNAISKPAGS